MRTNKYLLRDAVGGDLVSSLPVGIDQGEVCVLGGDVVRGPDGAVVGVGERPVKEGAVEVLLCRGAERVVVGQIHNLNSTVNLAVRICIYKYEYKYG